MINYSGTFSFSLNWLGWWCLALPPTLIVVLIILNAQNKRQVEMRSAARFESELQTEKARPTDSQHAGWTPPRLPASVIASIWTHRFFADRTRDASNSQRSRRMLETVNWTFNRAAPYVVSVALLSLQDMGLMHMSLRPGGHIDSFQRVRIEPTELARTKPPLPAVEGGLLAASVAFSQKLIGRSNEPAAYGVVRDWIHRVQMRPSKWVVDVAVSEGRELGLYEPVTDRRSWFGKLVGGAPKPVYSMPHLAACEDQVADCLKRWREFGDQEPELQQRLLTEIAFGIQDRQDRGG